MTNRESHEEAAGMAIDPLFFLFNGIDPNAECADNQSGTEPGGEGNKCLR